MHHRLSVKLLGKLEIEPESILPQRFGRKAQALLTYLVIEQKKVSVDRLLTLFWQGRRNKRNRLDNELSYVRRLFPSGTLPIKHGYLNWLVPDDFLQVDALDFLRLIEEPKGVDWETAVSLYRDAFWADSTADDCGPDFEQWLAGQRRRFEQAIMRLLTRLMAQPADDEQLKEWVEKLLHLDPLHEIAHQHHMRDLLKNGRLNAAVSHYQAYTNLLETELGIQPTVHMQRLYNKALRTRSMSANSLLPVPQLPIVGRHAEQTQIIERIQQPGCRLLTILGPGGIGKTRLAQQVAYDAQPFFADGVIFLDVTAVDTHQLPYQLANMLNISLYGQANPSAYLIELLKWESMLLVFDNFETHLPEGARFLSDLLSASPGITCLVTSRERVGLRSEWVFLLTGLAIPSLQSDTAETLRTPAVQLFYDRAQQQHNGLEKSATEVAAVREICRLVSGMPLAIELAAYWHHAYSCRDIQKMLERNLNGLMQAGTDVPARHWSIQAAFDYSWQRLNQNERSHFAALAIFPGQFPTAAAAAVTGISSLMLNRFVDRSLLENPEKDRYKMHPLLRQYGLAKLGEESNRFQQFYMQFEQYYYTFLQNRDLTNPIDQQAHLRDIFAEFDNILYVWKTAVSNQNISTINGLLEGFWSFHELTGAYTSGMAHMSEAVQALRRIANSTDASNLLIGRLLSRKAWFAMRLGQFYEGKQICEESMASIPNNYTLERGRTFVMAALMDWYLGHYQQAAQFAKLGEAICRRSDDYFWFSRAMLFNAMIQEAQGHLSSALKLYEENLKLSFAMNELYGVSNLLLLIAGIYLAQNKLPEAKQYLEQVDKYLDKHQVNFMTTYRHLIHSNLHLCEQSFAEARQMTQQALSMSREINERWVEGKCYIQLGHIAGLSGLFEEAEKHYSKALEIANKQRAAREILQAGTGIVDVFTRQSVNLPENLQILETILAHPALDFLTRRKAKQVKQLIMQKISENGAVHHGAELQQSLQMVVRTVTDSLEFMRRSDRIAPAAASEEAFV